MKIETISVRLSDAQARYLSNAADQLRADPGDLLLALAFGKIEADDGMDEDWSGCWLQELRAFVDNRRIPDSDVTRAFKWGMRGVEVAHV